MILELYMGIIVCCIWASLYVAYAFCFILFMLHIYVGTMIYIGLHDHLLQRDTGIIETHKHY
jgi:hypothetical protein